MKKVKKLTMFLAALMACGTMSVASGCMETLMTGFMPATSTEATDSDLSDASSEESESSVEETAKYVVTFQDEDGTVLQTSELEEGETPIYAGETPTKEATAQHTYTFAGWDKEIVAVTGETVYTATYTHTVNTYTVTFKNDDGTILQSTQVEYGETPSCAVAPEKVGDVQYNYTFNGWDKDVSAVTGEVTYIATYTQALNKYTVTFKNDDGTVLQSTQVDYGTIPEYTQATPTKQATAEFTYTFIGFGNISMVAGNATYTAKYEKTVNKYTVTFKNDDGSVLQSTQVEYGDLPVYGALLPVKEVTAEYSYTFKGWDKAIVAVTGEVEFVATYTAVKNKYLVTFKNDDGTILQSTQVEYGETPVYDGTPSKAADLQYVYTFAGWTPALTSVTGAATYVATYTAKANTYTITLKYNNGTADKVIEGDSYGLSASELYANAPQKEGYTFDGWYIGEAKLPASALITGEAVIEARYTINQYTVTFQNDDGTVLQSSKVTFGETPEYKGETPTKEANAQYTYTFAGWDKEISAVTGEVTYTATYTATEIVVNKHTVTFVNEDGTVLQSTEVKEGATPEYAGETPTKEATAQYTYTFAGWDSEISAVTGAVTYTATFTEAVRKYTITFANTADNTVETFEVEYGKTPEFTAPTTMTTTEAHSTTSHTFVEWDKAFEKVTGEATYTAKYVATASTWNGSYPTVASGATETDLFTGEGTKASPYVLTTATDLATLSALTQGMENGAVFSNADTYYVVAADMDMTAAFWLPICKAADAVGYGYFGANFNGQAHKITFNAVNTAAELGYDYGFFQGVQGATIENLTLESTINLKQHRIGGLAVNSNGATIKNVNSTLLINNALGSWGTFMGGMIATTLSGTTTFENCTLAGHVKTKASHFIGGFVGVIDSAGTANVVITNCINDAAIESPSSYAGGFIGRAEGSGDVTITRCTNNAAIRVKAEGVGGIVGLAGNLVDLNITDCINNGAITGYDSAKGRNAGGIVGQANSTADGITVGVITLTNCINNGSITAAHAGAAGIFAGKGAHADVIIDSCTNNGDVTSATIVSDRGVGGILDYFYGSTTMEITCKVINCTNTGTIKAGDVIATMEIGVKGGDRCGLIIGYQGVKAGADAVIEGNKFVCTVTWVDADGTVLETDTGIMANTGVTAEYNGATPTKAEDAAGTYTFIGWDKEVSEVTGSIIYTAKYETKVKKYTVTFVNNVDDEVMTAEVEYGKMPEYDAVATKQSSQEAYSTTAYKFSKWDKAFEEVTGNITYTALYTRVSTWNGALPEVASGATEADLFTGKGTKENPYVIATATDLATLAALTQNMTNDAVFSNANTYYVVTADMDMTAAFWTPICKAANAAGNGYFGANFNGQGHTITINSVNTAANLGYDYGFFQGIKGGTIENLTLAGTITIKHQKIGGLAYISGGVTLNNITNAINISNNLGGGNPIGGLVGNISTGTTTFENCNNTGAIKGTTQWVGGFVGRVHGDAVVVMTNCVNTGLVTSTYMYVGGLIAQAIESSKVTITNCSNSGAIQGRQIAAGIVGNVGNLVDLTITGCVNNGNISTVVISNAGGHIAGGIVGQGMGTSDALDVGVITITDCVNNGNISAATTNAGGIFGGKGAHADLIIDNCTNNGNVTAGTSTAGGILDYFYGSTSMNITCKITNCTNTGTITAGGVEATVLYGDKTTTEKVGWIVGCLQVRSGEDAVVDGNVNK